MKDEQMQYSRFTIENLGDAKFPSPIERLVGQKFVDDSERLLYSPHLLTATQTIKRGDEPEGFEIAGPRSNIYFNPPKTKAAIVTCGGLCPGINAVIRGIVMQLWYRYNCRNVIGIRYGYGGLAADAEPFLNLEPDSVTSIHTTGGTILGSSRGTPTTQEIVDSLTKHDIDILFTIGGDGTIRGASALWQEIKKRKLKISIVSIPKTIDNDIPFVRRTFGFETAVMEASKAIHSAHIESTGVPYGIGLVKLMGRHAGYIAANATLANGHANFCLIPEVPFNLEGKKGLFELLEDRLSLRRHAVIVAAEGAGQYFFEGKKGSKDPSGNRSLQDIGIFLKDRITEYFAAKKLPVVTKYIDPSYIIRSQAANSNDQLYCARLAQNAVHAAMAGKTGMLVGYWHGEMTHIPTSALENKNQNINPAGELWFNVLELTGQPQEIG